MELSSGSNLIWKWAAKHVRETSRADYLSYSHQNWVIFFDTTNLCAGIVIAFNGALFSKHQLQEQIE